MLGSDEVAGFLLGIFLSGFFLSGIFLSRVFLIMGSSTRVFSIRDLLS